MKNRLIAAIVLAAAFALPVQAQSFLGQGAAQYDSPQSAHPRSGVAPAAILRPVSDWQYGRRHWRSDWRPGYRNWGHGDRWRHGGYGDGYGRDRGWSGYRRPSWQPHWRNSDWRGHGGRERHWRRWR